jgi:pimeloyl-ACP methyl ester carboxylesterase
VTVLQWIRYLWVRAGVVVLLASPVAMYLMFRAQGMPPDTFETNAALQVTESSHYVTFQPVAATTRALILVPGCPADPLAYGPLARRLALDGVLTVIVKVPYRCAPWAPHQAELQRRVRGVFDLCYECAWTLAGHSRGARHALDLARDLPKGRIASLVLIGSTHPRDESFASLEMPVMKVLASEDGVAPVDDAMSRRDLLPPHTRWEVIEGGNHAQFGYYGYQLWDRPATISRELQQARVAGLLAQAITATP